MKTFLKRYWWLIVLFLVVIPLLVEGGISLIPWNGSDDGWLGFWGSYLGIIPSGLIAYFVAKTQIDAEKKNYRENHFKDMLIINYREMHTKITIFEKAANVFINPEMGNINTIKLRRKVKEVRKNIVAIDEVGNIIDILPKFDKKAELFILFKEIKFSSEDVKQITNEQINKIHDKKYDDDEEQLEQSIKKKCTKFDKEYYNFKQFLKKGIDEFSK
ncbi:hypothetical protein [Liquorilactobacillus hordei]|uniref:hypothetical protein n=1 Tax=Liquorilactobacillus hordei TaxID=468911 RepID=UPI0039EBD655